MGLSLFQDSFSVFLIIVDDVAEGGSREIKIDRKITFRCSLVGAVLASKTQSY